MDEKILVIDDDLDVLESVVDLLRAQGFDPESASDSTVAARLVQERQFDLILSDINMPHLTGLRLLTLVKECAPLTEVIMLTGYDAPGWVDEALEHKAFAFIKKPFSLDDLVERVKQALWKRRMAKGRG